MRKLVFSVCLLAAFAVQAETVYVNDVLRITVREQPGSGSAAVTVLTSGTEMQVLERQPGYLRIRSNAGVEGWVSEGFVTAEVPPRQRLAQLEKSHAQLQAELERLRGSSGTAGDQSAQLAAQLTALQEENTQLKEANAQLSLQTQSMDQTVLWVASLGVAAVMFLLGLYTGTQRYKNRVRQRFGGLEI